MNRYCSQCGAALKENARFCGNCGHSVVASSLEKKQAPGSMGKHIRNMKAFISGWIALLGGIALGIFSAQTIHADKQERIFGDYYNYKPPLTGHETFMITLAVVAGLAIICGIIILCNTNSDQ